MLNCSLHRKGELSGNIIKKLFLVIIYSLGFVSFCSGQSIPLQNTVFRPITITDGLSQGMVTKILQDRYGFMWFSTKDGLNQYDGYRFRIYRHDPEDSGTLSENFVQTIYEDRKGRLWVGTSSGYLDLFNHASGTFQHIK